MRARWMTGLLCLLLVPAAWATPLSDPLPAIGDNEDRVLDLLGPPRSWMKSERMSVLLFERGRVELMDGQVTLVDLVSAEAAKERRLAREALARQREADLRAERARRIEEGRALRERMLADPTLQSAMPGTKVAVWESFQRRFPEVTVAAELAAARSLRQDEDDRRALTARLASMERRVADAEYRAAEAEKEAKRSRDRGRTYTYYSMPFYGYGYPSYRQGVPPQSPAPCPPRRDLRLHGAQERSSAITMFSFGSPAVSTLDGSGLRLRYYTSGGSSRN